MKTITKIGAGVAAGGAALLAATAIASALPRASAADGAVTLAASSSAPDSTDDTSSSKPDLPRETPLTGSDAEKATAAALEAVPGATVIRVETDSDGVYEAHVRKSDGTEAVVKMDKSFAVTGIETFQGRGGHGPGGRGETALTGSAAEKATAAAQSAVAGGTVLRVETDSDGVYEAHVRKSDGTEVVVTMDEAFTVTGVEELQGRGHHGPRGDGDGNGQGAQEGQTASPSTGI